MKPFFFGTSKKPLFGLYHPPEGGSSRHGGVVLCHPFGPEYIRAHRSVRELASRLSQSGFHALRFDYYGCGDSAGASDEADVGQWMADISSAIEEVRETSGLPAVSLLGLRLGATLSAIVGSGRSDIDKLVLWDPVVNGKRYLAELSERHRAFFESRPKPRDLPEHDPPLELLGFPMPARLRAEIEALDLLALSHRPARSVLLVSSDGDQGTVSLRDHLARMAAEPDYQHIPGSKVWMKEEDEINQAVVPQAVVRSIASWLTGPQA